jgi:hypothetical protein
MTAVLLGLLITSAKSTYDTAQSEVIQMAAKVSLLDRVLGLYGPEAADARHALRDAIADGIRRAWPAKPSDRVRLEPNEQFGDAVYVAIHRLAPRDDTQRALKTQAAVGLSVSADFLPAPRLLCRGSGGCVRDRRRAGSRLGR